MNGSRNLRFTLKILIGRGEILYQVKLNCVPKSLRYTLCSYFPLSPKESKTKQNSFELSFNLLPICPKNTCRRRLWLQRSPQDNSQTAVLTDRTPKACQEIARFYYYFCIALVYRSSLETNDIILFTAFCF